MFKTLDEIATLSQKLYDSASQTIETVSFMSVEIADDDRKSPAAVEYINGSILIKTAPAIYNMELLVPQEFLENISQNLAVPGTDSEAKGYMVIDIVLELLNTVAGSLMRSTEMLVGPFILEIPEFEIGKPISRNAFCIKKYLVDDKHLITVAITKI